MTFLKLRSLDCGPDSISTQDAGSARLTSNPDPQSAHQLGAVWTLCTLWRGEYDSLGLANLNGIDTQWHNTTANPMPHNNILLKYYVDKKAQRVMLASPHDSLGGRWNCNSRRHRQRSLPGHVHISDLKFLGSDDYRQTSRIKIDGLPY